MAFTRGLHQTHRRIDFPVYSQNPKFFQACEWLSWESIFDGSIHWSIYTGLGTFIAIHAWVPCLCWCWLSWNMNVGFARCFPGQLGCPESHGEEGLQDGVKGRHTLVPIYQPRPLQFPLGADGYSFSFPNRDLGRRSWPNMKFCSFKSVTHLKVSSH